MASQRDKMAGAGATADTSTAESAQDRRTPPPLVSDPDDTGAPDRPEASPEAPVASEDDVILAEDDIVLEKKDEPVGEGEQDTPAEPVIPAGRGTSVPAGSPDDPAGTAAPSERDMFGAARGVGEPGTVPASTGPADELATPQPASAAAEPGMAEPGTAEPGTAEPVTAGSATAGPADRGATTGEPASGTVPAAALAEQQWPQIMALFVDDPRGSVERAAAAASEVAAALTASLDREQERLRASWQDNASTEDLRTVLQQYRAFCGRLEGLG